MPSTAGFDPGSVARTSGSALTASVEREPRDMPAVLPVARQQRQPLHQRRRGDQGVFLLEIRVPAAQRPVTPRDGGPQADAPEPAQRRAVRMRNSFRSGSKESVHFSRLRAALAMSPRILYVRRA